MFRKMGWEMIKELGENDRVYRIVAPNNDLFNAAVELIDVYCTCDIFRYYNGVEDQFRIETDWEFEIIEELLDQLECNEETNKVRFAD